MSMTSRSYRFFKCCSQIRLIFSTASADFDVDPLTYKRKTYFSRRELEPGGTNPPANPGFRFRSGLLFFGGIFMLAFMYCSTYLPQIEAHQQQQTVGQVPDDRSERWWKPSYQGWNCYDLVAESKLRILPEVDHFDLIAALQMLFTHRLEVVEGANGLGSLAGHVEPQIPNLRFLGARFARPRPSSCLGCRHSAHRRDFRASFPLVGGCVRLPAQYHLSTVLHHFLTEQFRFGDGLLNDFFFRFKLRPEHDHAGLEDPTLALQFPSLGLQLLAAEGGHCFLPHFLGDASGTG